MADQDEAVLKSGSSDGSPAGPPPPSPWISPANVGEGHDNGNPMLGELIPHMQDLKKRVSPQAGQLLDKLSGRIASATPQQPTTPQAKPFDPSTLPLVASAKPAASIGAMAAPPNITTMIPGASPLPQQLQGMADVPGRDTAPLTARNRAQDLENAPYHSGMMEKADAVQNPFLRGLAKTGATVADVIASGVFPKFGQFVPGTTAHHELLQGLAEHGANQEQAREAEDQKLSEEPLNREHLQAETGLENAQTQNLKDKGKDTIETDQGLLQWNPDTQKYDVNVGKAPIKEGAAKVETDVNGNLIQVASDGTAKPVTMNGQPVKGKQPEVSRPLTKEMADAQNDIWNATAQKHGLPINQFHEGMSADDAKTITNGLSTVIGKQQGDTHITIARDNADTKASASQDKETQKAVHDLANSYRKDFSAAQTQLDTLDQAKTEINSGAVGQAVGTIKTIVALAGGKGSGLRVTQPELNSIIHSRGFKGDFDAFLQKFDTGKPLTSDQVKEISSVLDAIKAKAIEKESRLNDVLDKLQNAGSKDEVNKIDSEYRKSSLHGGTTEQQANTSDMINVQIPGQPVGQIHASQKDAFFKKYPNAKVVQ